MGEEPDTERVQTEARDRQRERAESTERILERLDALLARTDYPTTSEELATEYADDVIDLPNETESLGSVFDRLVDERFDSPEEAREAAYGEVTGQAGTDAEYNEERDLAAIDDGAPEAEGEPEGFDG